MIDFLKSTLLLFTPYKSNFLFYWALEIVCARFPIEGIIVLLMPRFLPEGIKVLLVLRFSIGAKVGRFRCVVTTFINRVALLAVFLSPFEVGWVDEVVVLEYLRWIMVFIIVLLLSFNSYIFASLSLSTFIMSWT